jgi:exopolysaccharide production protein ExoZ
MAIERKYDTIQVLRLVAAASVALTHATFYVKTRGDASMPIWDAGSQGVQIFFVISGFVMALSSGSLSGSPIHWRDFIWRRLLRIVPLYWVMNLLKILMFVVFPSMLLAKPDVANIIFSLFFVPSRNENGIIETFYGVGWTLNFEIFFYALVALALYVHRSIFVFTIPILAVFSCLSIFRQEDWPSITYLFHSYLLNFIWGLLIAKIASNIDMDRPFTGLSMIALSGYFIFISPIDPTMSILGLQYAALVFGFLLLEKKMYNAIPRIFIFGGNASYSLYLTHAMVGPVAVFIASKFELGGAIFQMTISMLLIFMVAAFSYHFIERGLDRALQTFIIRIKNRNDVSLL